MRIISETFETELETLSAWMDEADTREIIMDPQRREIGFAWFQEPNRQDLVDDWSRAA